MSVPISTSNTAFPWESIPGQQLTALICITSQNLTCKNQVPLKPFKIINVHLFQSLIICVTSSSLPCTALWICSQAGVWFCVLSLVLWSRWNRGTRWTALRSSLTLHPTNWFSWTSCSPEQWCLARCEPPCTPSLMYSAASLVLQLPHIDTISPTTRSCYSCFWHLLMHSQWFASILH